jgi:type IV pilus assembly protein PilA
MIDRIKNRLAKEESGFTLIELLVVMIILAILMAIAVPSYLGFKDKATDSALKSDIRAAIPSIEAYAGDHSDSYVGLSTVAMKTYDSGLSAHISIPAAGAAGAPTATTYCVVATNGSHVWSVQGPGADLSDSTNWHQSATCA